MNKANSNLLAAYQKGYRISPQGVPLSPSGLPLQAKVRAGGHYPTFKAFIDAEQPVRLKVHRLQAYQLYGDKLFAPDTVVRHLNGCKTDNSSTNIALGTQQENSLDIPPEVRKANTSQAGTRSARKTQKLPQELVAKLRAENQQGRSKKDIAREYAPKLGCHPSAIIQMLQGRTYSSQPK